ncbi:MAG TPA: beta-ketoacyl-ACP synthase III [Rubrobacteraceae bacterium]|nr:beta-ketoacyl-ACP synthase III [Rubrobacteraceae bacterium]
MNGARAVGKIVGVGRALGGRVVINRDFEEVLDTDDAWIVERTGIKERHYVADGEDCVTLAVDASKRALKHAGIGGEEINLILCATSTAPESMPTVACLVGDAIGAVGAGAMDLAAACAGYSYAASVADSMLRSGAASRVLLIGADVMTAIVDQKERSTAVLFGDGAGAVVLERGSGESGFVDHILGADGRMAPLLRAGHPGADEKLYQNGREVFKWAVRIFPEMVEKLLARNDVGPGEVQYIIPHQANTRIIQAALRKMEIPEEKIVVNLDRFGNTSAASIPISYPDIYDNFEPGKYVITAGFGAGLTWAANLYRI